MKKLLSLLLVCCLFGCASEKTTVCKLESNTMKITNTLVSKNDKVLKQTNMNELNYIQFGYNKDSITVIANNYQTVYGQVGVEYSYTIDDTYLKETVVVDYQNADFEKLASVGLIQSSSKNIKFVSLETTLDSYKDQGFTCK